MFIEKKAQLTLLGTEIDYVEDKLSSEFVFNTPTSREPVAAVKALTSES